MTMTEEQIEVGKNLVAIAGPVHGTWLQARLNAVIEAAEFGSDEDVANAVRTLYRQAPVWIRRRLFPNRWSGRPSMFQTSRQPTR